MVAVEVGVERREERYQTNLIKWKGYKTLCDFHPLLLFLHGKNKCCFCTLK